KIPPKGREDDPGHVIGMLKAELLEVAIKRTSRPQAPVVPDPGPKPVVVLDHIRLGNVSHALHSLRRQPLGKDDETLFEGARYRLGAEGRVDGRQLHRSGSCRKCDRKCGENAGESDRAFHVPTTLRSFIAFSCPSNT